MKKTVKQHYEAPYLEFQDLEEEGIICASGNTDDLSLTDGDDYGEDDFNS